MAKRTNESVVFRNAEEREAWDRFAAGAASAYASDAEEAVSDASDAATFADELLRLRRVRDK
jgi:hypothetical protein